MRRSLLSWFPSFSIPGLTEERKDRHSGSSSSLQALSSGHQRLPFSFPSSVALGGMNLVGGRIKKCFSKQLPSPPTNQTKGHLGKLGPLCIFINIHQIPKSWKLRMRLGPPQLEKHWSLSCQSLHFAYSALDWLPECGCLIQLWL